MIEHAHNTNPILPSRPASMFDSDRPDASNDPTHSWTWNVRRRLQQSCSGWTKYVGDVLSGRSSPPKQELMEEIAAKSMCYAFAVTPDDFLRTTECAEKYVDPQSQS